MRPEVSSRHAGARRRARSRSMCKDACRSRRRQFQQANCRQFSQEPLSDPRLVRRHLVLTPLVAWRGAAALVPALRRVSTPSGCHHTGHLLQHHSVHPCCMQVNRSRLAGFHVRRVPAWAERGVRGLAHRPHSCQRDLGVLRRAWRHRGAHQTRLGPRSWTAWMWTRPRSPCL